MTRMTSSRATPPQAPPARAAFDDPRATADAGAMLMAADPSWFIHGLLRRRRLAGQQQVLVMGDFPPIAPARFALLGYEVVLLTGDAPLLEASQRLARDAGAASLLTHVPWAGGRCAWAHGSIDAAAVYTQPGVKPTPEACVEEASRLLRVGGLAIFHAAPTSLGDPLQPLCNDLDLRFGPLQSVGFSVSQRLERLAGQAHASLQSTVRRLDAVFRERCPAVARQADARVLLGYKRAAPKAKRRAA